MIPAISGFYFSLKKKKKIQKKKFLVFFKIFNLCGESFVYIEELPSYEYENFLVRNYNDKNFIKAYNCRLENAIPIGETIKISWKKAPKVDFRNFLDPFLSFTLKIILRIYDPCISWILFGTKNHKRRGPPVSVGNFDQFLTSSPLPIANFVYEQIVTSFINCMKILQSGNSNLEWSLFYTTFVVSIPCTWLQYQ